MNISLHVIEVGIETVHRYPGNPRKNITAVKPVAELIRMYGFRQPIVVDREYVIVVGDTRYQAAQLLELKTIPVHVAKDLTPAQARAYRIADNKSSEIAEWDFQKLENELLALQHENFDLGSLGFDSAELEEMLNAMSGAEDVPDFQPVDVATQPRLDRRKKIICPECGHEFRPA